MARIVLVHGVGQAFLGPQTLHRGLAGALLDGLALADYPAVDETDVRVAFYGDLFREKGRKGGEDGDDLEYLHPLEAELLDALWAGAAEAEPDRVPSPDAKGQKVPTPRGVQRALDALSHSKSLAGVAERFLVGTLRQMRRYLTEPSIRSAVRERVAASVEPDTTVMVGHSLGSIVAYETLCANPKSPVTTFVSLGSPLGIRNIVFDRLEPAPHGGRGWWPSPLRQWTNVYDRHDVVALVKELAPLFGGTLVDQPVDNGWRVHDLVAHLTAVETGRAVADGLRR